MSPQDCLSLGCARFVFCTARRARHYPRSNPFACRTQHDHGFALLVDEPGVMVEHVPSVRERLAAVLT